MPTTLRALTQLAQKATMEASVMIMVIVTCDELANNSLYGSKKCHSQSFAISNMMIRRQVGNTRF
jgi:hypothetical protein